MGLTFISDSRQRGMSCLHLKCNDVYETIIIFILCLKCEINCTFVYLLKREDCTVELWELRNREISFREQNFHSREKLSHFLWHFLLIFFFALQTFPQIKSFYNLLTSSKGLVYRAGVYAKEENTNNNKSIDEHDEPMSRPQTIFRDDLQTLSFFPIVLIL